jgi:hypothetical protein
LRPGGFGAGGGTPGVIALVEPVAPSAPDGAWPCCSSVDTKQES